jgi:hypothetical protein
VDLIIIISVLVFSVIFTKIKPAGDSWAISIKLIFFI